MLQHLQGCIGESKKLSNEQDSNPRPLDHEACARPLCLKRWSAAKTCTEALVSGPNLKIPLITILSDATARQLLLAAAGNVSGSRLARQKPLLQPR